MKSQATSGRFLEGLFVGHLDEMGAAGHHGLKPLGPHDRAEPAPAQRPVDIVHDSRVADQVFPGQADAGDIQLGAIFLPEDFGGFSHPQTPEMVCFDQFGPAVVDDQGHGFWRTPSMIIPSNPLFFRSNPNRPRNWPIPRDRSGEIWPRR